MHPLDGKNPFKQPVYLYHGAQMAMQQCPLGHPLGYSPQMRRFKLPLG